MKQGAGYFGGNLDTLKAGEKNRKSGLAGSAFSLQTAIAVDEANQLTNKAGHASHFMRTQPCLCLPSERSLKVS
jgi:hypothetical protein